ncbi:unnamed protein product [Trichogramma brassicae]|uniref:Uncharacterized protein n=1 Tax=Trichogramma brassicae TaxID=86971 RepID=A0A6H5J5A2_9HYME|nr:unnamed protein product [Trichogramma brassicae]
MNGGGPPAVMGKPCTLHDGESRLLRLDDVDEADERCDDPPAGGKLSPRAHTHTYLLKTKNIALFVKAFFADPLRKSKSCVRNISHPELPPMTRSLRKVIDRKFNH